MALKFLKLGGLEDMRWQLSSEAYPRLGYDLSCATLQRNFEAHLMLQVLVNCDPGWLASKTILLPKVKGVTVSPPPTIQNSSLFI